MTLSDNRYVNKYPSGEANSFGIFNYPCNSLQVEFVISTQARIHLFPLLLSAHSQKTFVSSMWRITNKSPFKDVYPLTNADNLMINIYTVVRENCVTVVSIMAIEKGKN